MTQLSDYNLPEIDFYGAVHKGLRLGLCDLIIRMGRIDACDVAAVQQAVDDLDGLLYLCESHAAHEDRHLHYALEARHAGASVDQARDHELQRLELPQLRALALQVAEASDAERPRLWRVLQLRYARFVGDNLVHMTDEEVSLQPRLDTLYSQRELSDIHRRLVASIGPEEMLAFTRLMLQAASPPERAAMHRRLEETAVRPAL